MQTGAFIEEKFKNKQPGIDLRDRPVGGEVVGLDVWAPATDRQ
ncbi:MAG: hypothetical protein M0014_10800 [Actinomycetota bacterium]|jgi:hypothetical protein|nr:hypothetical protein [Actinomycetota bacterium]